MAAPLAISKARPSSLAISSWPSPGTTVLVGASGSGKSTALRVLARLRDADAGVVSAWGRDVRGVTGAALRQRIGFVTQARRVPRAVCYYATLLRVGVCVTTVLLRDST